MMVMIVMMMMMWMMMMMMLWMMMMMMMIAMMMIDIPSFLYRALKHYITFRSIIIVSYRKLVLRSVRD